jgi:hypothetical protein
MDLVKQGVILEPVGVDNFSDHRGDLDIAELHCSEKFETKRIYFISNVPKSQTRGAHGHKHLKQIFFALAGKFELRVTDGLVFESVELRAHETGYFLPAGYWRDLSNFSDDAVCLVLASEHFDEADYIFSYDEFMRWKNNG